jgi:hypothetical protein
METVFYDINKFPKDYGILVFLISISRTHAGTGQSAEECLKYIEYFSPKKISEPKVGLNIIYGDYLYMNSSEQASLLKEKFMNIVLNHKNAFSKLVTKNWEKFQIQQAFSFQVWNQLYLNYRGLSFTDSFKELKDIYNQDEYFQKIVQDDAVFCKRELSKEQIDFFLEEFLLTYFITKKQIILPNEYVQGREKWVLPCYPGPFLKGQIYLYQRNFFELLVPENIYENSFYDLSEKVLVDCNKIDLDSYNYSYLKK